MRTIMILLTACSLSAATYTVKRGDTLYGIAERVGVSFSALCRMNRIDPKRYTLKSGARLTVPEAVKPPARSVKLPPTVTAKAPAKPSPKPAPKKIEVPPDPAFGLFHWPYRGAVVRTFGLSENVMNTGIDIRGNFGDPVTSARAGIVDYVGTMRGYGTVVILKHENDYNSIYAHLSETTVKKGESVDGNAVIGKVGMSGFTDTPELHFKICVKGKPKNPLAILPKG